MAKSPRVAILGIHLGKSNAFSPVTTGDDFRMIARYSYLTAK